MKRSAGMDCVVLSFHKDEKGTIILNSLSVFHYIYAYYWKLTFMTIL
jgi:hypothetical protein